MVNCGGMSLKLLGLIAPPYPSVAFDSSSEMGTYQTSAYLRQSYDMHHEKTDLKVFVVVIPKEGWARVHPSFGMTPTF